MKKLLLLSILLLSNLVQAEGPNVVLIVVDTLRADHLPFYGYKKNTAPFLKSIAEKGALFKHTYSTSSWTAPATASILTSLLPSQTGVMMGMNSSKRLTKVKPESKLNRIPEKVETIAETLKKNGYKTFGISDNGNISEQMGFNQGFDKFHNFRPKRATAKGIEAKVIEWEKDLKTSEKYFLFIQYMDPHSPYNKREPWYEKKKSTTKNTVERYDSEINYVDEHLKSLFSKFNWDKNTLFVFTSDHGEEFWEHGKLGHGKTLYNEVIRVPLFFYWPEKISKNIVEKPVSTIDIVPSISNLLDINPVYQVGVDLFEKENTKSLERNIVSHIWKQLSVGKELEMYSMIDQKKNKKVIFEKIIDWKTGEEKSEEKKLFDLNSDYDEKTNIHKIKADVFNIYMKKLAEMKNEFAKNTFKREFSDYDYSEHFVHDDNE